MKAYFDKSLFANPLSNYIRWITGKIFYQVKNWGKHLRISYGTIVRNCKFGEYTWLGNHNVVLNCEIGSHTYVSGYSTILNCKIGKYCAIASNVKISPGNHPTSGFVSIHPVTYMCPDFHSKKFTTDNNYQYNEKVVIGNDVWIGTNAVILGGITIADGAVIAANAVVTKDVGEYEIVGGVPAKLIRKRFTAQEIALLKKVRWWDRNDAWISENIARFWSITEFCDHFKDLTND